MKKIFKILILSLFSCNIALADLYNLKIDLNTSEKTTKKIFIKKGFASKCTAFLEDSNENSSLSINIYSIEDKVNMNIAVSLDDGNESGSVSFDYEVKINRDGSLGKKKYTGKKLTGSSTFKKEIKPYVKIFKNLGNMVFDDQGYYPNYGMPLKSVPIIIDGNKLFKKMINLIAKSMPEQSKQLKKVGSHIIKNSDINVTKEYIGYSEIGGERYNLIRYKFKIDYLGNDPEYRNFTNDFNIDQVTFFHDSGLPTITYDIIPYSDTPMHHSMVCKVYENNSLISEISVPILKDPKKIKNLNKLDPKRIVDQLKSLNDLYKSGVLTKEEFEKAKKKILN